MEVKGSGDIKLSVNAKKIMASVVGSGDIVLNGNADNFIGMVKGSGNIKATKFEAKKSYIRSKRFGRH